MLPTALYTLTALLSLTTLTTASPTPQFRPDRPPTTPPQPSNPDTPSTAPAPITLLVSTFNAFIPHSNRSTDTDTDGPNSNSSPTPNPFIWFRLVDPRPEYPYSGYCSSYLSPGGMKYGARLPVLCRPDGGGFASVGNASFWFAAGGEELVLWREWMDGGDMYIRGEAPQQTNWSETDGGAPELGLPGNKTVTMMGTSYRRSGEWAFPIESIIG